MSSLLRAQDSFKESFVTRCRYEALYDKAYPHLDPELTTEEQGLCGVCACPSHSNGVNAKWAQCRTVLAMAAALDEAVGEVFDDLKTSGAYDNTVIVYLQ